MINLKGLLREITNDIEEAQGSLDARYRELGEELLATSGEGGFTGQLKELLQNARGTQELIEAGESNRERLAKLLEQASTSRAAIEEKRGELNILEEEIEPYYEGVGRAAVDALVDDEAEAAPYKKILDQLRDLEVEIKQVDREVNRGGMRGEEEQGIVTQAIAGGRRLYLQGVARTKGMRASVLYRRLGREICDSDLLSRQNSRAFMSVLEPVLKNKEQTKRINTQISTMRNKLERLESEIAALSEGDRPQRRLQRFTADLEKASELMELQLKEIGGYYADHSGSAADVPKKVKAKLTDAKRARKELSALTKRRERVEAAIEVEELERRVEIDRGRVRTLENNVKKANKEIASLSTEIKDLNEERERLAKLRGPVEELTLETVGEE